MTRKSLLTFILLLPLLSTLTAGDFQSSFPEYTRTWVGPDYWSNRLQDWRVNMGRLECLNGDANKPMRTTHWLSGEISHKTAPFTIEVRTGSLGYYRAADGTSWSGLLIGAGEGRLDYRSAALIHHLPGKGGGLLAVFNDQGKAQFLTNDSEDQTSRNPVGDLSTLRSADRTGSLGNHEDYLVRLSGSRVRNGKRDLELIVTDIHTGSAVSKATLANVDALSLQGGIAMVSHGGESEQRRFWFRDFKANGGAIALHPERQFGPILGAIYCLSGRTLKLNAHFPPLGFGDSPTAILEIKSPYDENWKEIGTAPIESPSYTALFRVENFEPRLSTKYRIRYSLNGEDVSFHGNISERPQVGDTLKIVALTCYQNIAKSADAGWGEGFYGTPAGRWTQENLWFPHNNLVARINEQEPDLIALLGDQIYEGGNPTGSDSKEGNPHLDYLYKWYITLWDLGRLTRNFPTVALTDDHDMYQGDLWGDGGTASINGQNKDGGYIHEPEFIRMVERTQTAANPDAALGVSMRQSLTNYFTSFSLADVDIAIIEDRKFKSMPTLIGPVEKNGSKIIDPNYKVAGADIPNGQLLGVEQEAFLKEWATNNRNRTKIGLTQTTYASLHTDPDGAKWIDLDSGGWPQSARNRALEILGKGNTLLLSGDTHLPSVVQHGVHKHRDSIWQFTVPAIANKYRRWWTPSAIGENRSSNSPGYTGDHYDGFGNRITVATVGNPTISNTEVFKENKRRGKGYASEHLLLDRAVTKDGYGLIIISPDRNTVTFECWPVATENNPQPTQHDDWPVVLSRDSISNAWTQIK